MAVLSAIGRFFKKIWDWIKQTAWIQPLLIVGIIFGVIFSIPSIVEGIKNGKAKRTGAEYYYINHQLKLAGDEDSKAEKVTKALTEIMEDSSATPDTGIKESKFFLVLVKKDCEFCAEFKDAFIEMESNMKSGNDANFKDPNGDSFALYSIFIDEGTSTLPKGEDSLFSKYLERNTSFFSLAAAAVEENPYTTDHVNEEDLNAFYEPDEESGTLLTPTIMLCETKDPEIDGYEKGVTEIMFSKPVNTTKSISKTYDLAKYLMDCWNHEGDFKR